MNIFISLCDLNILANWSPAYFLYQMISILVDRLLSAKIFRLLKKRMISHNSTCRFRNTIFFLRN